MGAKKEGGRSAQPCRVALAFPPPERYFFRTGREGSAKAWLENLDSMERRFILE